MEKNSKSMFKGIANQIQVKTLNDDFHDQVKSRILNKMAVVFYKKLADQPYDMPQFHTT